MQKFNKIYAEIDKKNIKENDFDNIYNKLFPKKDCDINTTKESGVNKDSTEKNLFDIYHTEIKIRDKKKVYISDIKIEDDDSLIDFDEEEKN